jgi:hypothetical protein
MYAKVLDTKYSSMMQFSFVLSLGIIKKHILGGPRYTFGQNPRIKNPTRMKCPTLAT